MDFNLGIDLGTSSVKVTAIDNNGEIKAESSAKYSIDRPKLGWAEQGPKMWWKKTFTALKETIDKLRSEDKLLKINAIGVTGQMHGLVALDQAGEPIYPCIIWADNRTEDELVEIKNKLSQSQIKRLANPVVNSFTAPKILWMLKHIEDFKDKVDKVMLPKDYIVYRLCNLIKTDMADASATLLYNVKERSWDYDIISTLGIDEDIFPEVLAPGSSVGSMDKGLINQLNLTNSTPNIISCGGDAPVSALANGAIEAGTACVSLGTAGQIILPIDRFSLHPEFKVHTFQYAISSLWYLMGAILAAGYNFTWWLENILGEDINEGEYLKAKEDDLAKIAPVSDGLIYLPYINGERSPLNDPNATGVFFGLTSDHTNLHILRSIMEGIAFAIRSNYEVILNMGLEIDRIYFTGGGAKNKLWIQIFADILNKPVYQTDKNYSAAYGAALMAADEMNDISSLSSILSDNTKNYKLFRPDKDKTEVYNQAFMIFKDLYNNNTSEMKKLARLRNIKI